MEVGGYVMLAIVAVLALGCINSSIKAHNDFAPFLKSTLRTRI